MDIAHSATYDDIGFELACVMYNIGAVHASIAVNEARESEDVSKDLCNISIFEILLLFWVLIARNVCINKSLRQCSDISIFRA